MQPTPHQQHTVVKGIYTLFVVLSLVAGADLMGEKSTAGWLLTDGWFGVREKHG